MARTVVLTSMVILLAFGAIGSIAAPEPQTELTGIYHCEGINPDGSQYKGVVEIDKIKDTFRVRWGLTDGMVTGVGIFSDGVLAVSYFGGVPAVVVYKVEGTRLVGHWAMGVEGALYVETLTKMTSAPPRPRNKPSPSGRPAVYTQARL